MRRGPPLASAAPLALQSSGRRALDPHWVETALQPTRLPELKTSHSVCQRDCLSAEKHSSGFVCPAVEKLCGTRKGEEKQDEIQAREEPEKDRLGGASRGGLFLLRCGDMPAGHLVHQAQDRRDQKSMEAAGALGIVFHNWESRSMTGFWSERETNAGLRIARHMPKAPPPSNNVRHSRFIHIQTPRLIRSRHP